MSIIARVFKWCDTIKLTPRVGKVCKLIWRHRRTEMVQEVLNGAPGFTAVLINFNDPEGIRM